MRFISGIAMLFLITSLQAQEKKVASFDVKAEILSAAIDRAGDFYLVLANGELQKYNIDGTLLTAKKYSTALSLFDPTITIRLMAYQRETQTYEWLSPNLEVMSSETVEPAFAVEPSLICPSGDKDLWILDNADLTVKRVRPAGLSVLNEFTLQGLKEVLPNFIREYQNFLFVKDVNGISIYNATGRRLRQIEIKNLFGFNFLGEELYYLDQGKVQLLDLFTAERRVLKIPTSCREVLITENRIICINPLKVEIYTFNPY